jgi:aminotransferase
MKKYLNKQSMALQQGAIRAMFDKAAGMSDVINLGIGEPDMTTTAVIIEAGMKALMAGHTHYTPNAGILELREAVAGDLIKQSLKYDPRTEIMITTGGMGGLALSLMVMLEPGDEVLIQDPQWLNYFAQVKFFGGVPVPVPVKEENGFAITAEAIEARITNKTKILMLNSPNNPTGAVLDLEELKRIAEVAKRHDLIVLSDEVYSTIVYDDTEHLSIATLEGMKDRTVVINSFSKSYAMTGWRIGYAAGNQHIIDKMIRLQENVVACVNSGAQYAAIEALKRPELATEMTELYRKRRNLVVEGLQSINGISCLKPKGSFYVFAGISGIGVDEVTFANELLEQQQAVVIPGSAFGEHGKGYVRICYANSEKNLARAIERIRRYVSGKQ